jgi:hypothetical protein
MILGVFGSPDGAGAVRGTLRESERRRLIGIVGLALIKRDDEGRLEVLESRRAGDWVDDLPGSFPAILQLMLGPIGDVSSSTRLRGIADALSPGSSAIAALIEHRWVDDIRALMEEAGAETITEALRSEILDALASRRDLVLTAGGADWRAVPLRRLGLSELQSDPAFGQKGRST